MLRVKWFRTNAGATRAAEVAAMVLEWLGAHFHAQGPLGWFGPVIEIGILVVAIYGMLGFLRGTRGAGVARGLFVVGLTVIIVLLFLSQNLGLDNLSFLLDNLLGVGAIAVVVIFQPEIRHGLVRLGETVRKIGSRGGGLDKEIADAAVEIAKRGEGALIVVERKVQMGLYIDSGVPIDATVTSALLRTIFFKNTPLHDGAVIIRGERLAAAGCLLPLSENVEACRGMGTRHRAALGLSEETDAVTVVVSEETGGISVAFEGNLEQGFDYERLRKTLRELMATATLAADTA